MMRPAIRCRLAAKTGLAAATARRLGCEPQWRPQRADRKSSQIPGRCCRARRSGAATCPHGGTRAVRRHRHQRAFVAAGQYLAAAATAFNIVSTDHVWVQASPKETELTYVKPGQKVTVEVDTYPDQRWTGTVDRHQPASGLELFAAAPKNTSGKLGQGRAADPDARQRPNVPGKPQLRVGNERRVERRLPDMNAAAELPDRLVWIVRSRSCLTEPSSRRRSIAPLSRPASSGRHHAGARYHHRQRGAALHAGQRLRQRRPDHWVLTSYIVAAAIMTPPSGFLANRFGRKRVLMVAIAGSWQRPCFAASRSHCSRSSLSVAAGLFRCGTGSDRAIDSARHLHPRRARSAMALFGVRHGGTGAGTVIGGYLTDQFSWRWFSTINVPIGALAFAGIRSS